MSLPPGAPERPFDRLVWIMNRLLDPGGCPWDREQTHESIKQYLIEEAYEVHEAIGNEDWAHLREELGDVGLQVVFHAAMAERQNRFDVDDVYEAICEKLIRRHPHVFADTRAEDSGQVLENWEKIKQRERRDKRSDESLLAGVPRSLPALQKALRMQGKAARVGFDWPDTAPVLEKIREEFEELAERLESGSPADQSEEFGDLLFAMVNLARHHQVQPEEALQEACAKFERRFRHIERRAAEQGRDLDAMDLEAMDRLWDEAKHKEKAAD